VHNYGKQTDVILKKFDEFMDENQEEKLIKAEVWFAINCEMACNPTDFFMRRTGRLFFDMPSVILYKNLVIQLFKEQFLWDKKTTEVHESELEHQLKMATNFV
jgi:glycerol-3-phosphate dehydrogenase